MKLTIEEIEALESAVSAYEFDRGPFDDTDGEYAAMKSALAKLRAEYDEYALPPCEKNAKELPQ